MKDLVELARAVRAKAYAPYSNYQVGAVVRGESGRLFAGCNVENSAYPQGQCAEAGAIAAMVGAGDRRIMEALVMGGDEPCMPCGGCRQRLSEFAGPETPVHVATPDGHVASYTMAQLLPFAFRLDR